MIHRRRIIPIATSVVLSLAVVGCGVLGSPSPSFCDGIDAQFGGCDADRPVFNGTTCADVADEFGRQINDRSLAIIAGPADANGESRAVRMTHLMVVAASLANKHLRDNGLVADCDMDEFMAEAEAQFSDELRQRAGEVVDDGSHVRTYEDWRAALVGFVGVIDQEEDVPYGG
jgi:hypothetical protein